MLWQVFVSDKPSQLKKNANKCGVWVGGVYFRRRIKDLDLPTLLYVIKQPTLRRGLGFNTQHRDILAFTVSLPHIKYPKGASSKLASSL